MEVFEIKKQRIERESSATSSRGYVRNSKVGYILAMAGIILFTSALLVALHFTREYTHVTEQILSLEEKNAERLERRTCEEPFCNTRECVSVASAMLESMNLKADPCFNFYDYACGGYSRMKAVEYANDIYSPVKESQLELLIDIRKFMDNPPLGNETSSIKKMRKFYNSCISTGLRDELENRSLSFWFADNEFVPGDYVIGNELDFEHPVEWSKLVSKLEEYQIHTLFKPHFVSREHTAPEKMEVDCQVPFLQAEAYRNTTDSEFAFQFVMYKEMMDAALELLHLKREARKEFIDDIIKIETDIANAVSSAELSPDSHLNEEHKQQLKNIWSSVIGAAMQQMEIASICAYDLQTILNVLNNAPNKSVVRYVMWRMLMQLMQYMGTEFRDLHIHYMTKLPHCDYAYQSKWKQCADVVRIEFGLVAMKALFDNRYLKKENLDAVNDDFLDMKRDIALASNTIEGVDENVASKFLDKLKHMKLTTGYLDTVNEDEILDRIYEDLEVDDNYFLNIINLKRFKTRKYLTSLWYGNNGDPTSGVSLDYTPLGSSSSYDYITNTVHVDLGLFRPPLFVQSENIPSYLKFGYSSLVARQVSRAFDSTGSFYDGEGQRFEKIWWPTSMEQRYENFISCIRDQTEQLTKRVNADINDTRTLNNIIADLGSFLIPYEGLKTHLRSHQAEKPLPGVSLNKEQTFFVQTAQTYCELRDKRSSDNEAKFRLPPKLRVNGAVSNMEDFGTVFNCPPNSAMNPERKCSLFQF